MDDTLAALGHEWDALQMAMCEHGNLFANPVLRRVNRERLAARRAGVGELEALAVLVAVAQSLVATVQTS